MITRLTPRTFAHVLFKRRRKLMLTFLCALAGSLLYSVLATPVYRSQASILSKLNDQDMATPDVVSNREAKASAAAAGVAQQVVNSEQLLIRSHDVLRSVVMHLGPDAIYPGLSLAAMHQSIPAVNLATERLERDLDVTVNQDTNVLLLSLNNPNPAVAQRTLKAIIQATFDKQASVMRDPRLQVIESKREALRKTAMQAQEALVAFRSRTGINSLDQEQTLLLKQRDQIEQDLNDAQSQLDADRHKITALQTARRNTPEQIALSNENDNTRSQVDDARQHLLNAEMRYQQARQNFAVGNPELLDAQQQLELARRNFEQVNAESSARIRTGPNPNWQTIDDDLTATRSDISGLGAAIAQRKQQLQQINTRLGQLDANAPQLIDLQNRADVALKDFQSYLERTQAAKIVDDLNREGITGSLSVLQWPTMPWHASAPKKGLLVTAGAFAGLLLGMGLCLMTEMLDSSISLPEQVEPLLGLPLLLTIRLQGRDMARAAMPHGVDR